MKAIWGVTGLLGCAVLARCAWAAPLAKIDAADLTNAPAATGLRAQTNGLVLNLQGAALNQVIEFLGRAAGLTLNQKAELRGRVSVWSEAPLQREETVKLVAAVLRQNGYAVLRDGKTLTVVNADQARTANLKVIYGDDPDAIELSDEVVLQIIPVRHANASQLVNNLQLLLPTSTTLAANESANSLLLVATQTEIRRALLVVKTLDNALASVSAVRVFPLRYADAKELASALQQLFTSTGQNQNANGSGQNGPSFGFGPGGGGFGPPGSPAGSGAQDTTTASSGSAARGKIIIAADERSNALVVNAPVDVFTSLARVIEECDQQTVETTELRRFPLRYADPTELADQLTQLFGSSSSGNSDQNQNAPMVVGPPPPMVFAGGPPGGGATDGASDSPSAHRRKQSQVVAVADPRTSSLLVNAATSLMPQIAKLIAQLDDSPGRREVVQTFDLRYADPQDIYQTLQDLFNRSGSTRSSDNRNSLLGQNNPLSTRQTQQQSTSSGSSGFGNSTGMGNSGGAAGGGAGAGAQ